MRCQHICHGHSTLSIQEWEEELEELEEEELTRITLDSPPYGTASSYNKLVTTQTYNVGTQQKLGAVTNVLLTGIFTTYFGVPSGIAASMTNLVLQWIQTSPAAKPYLNNSNLYCKHQEYTSSTYADTVKVVETFYADSALTVPVGTVVYYWWYI